MESLVAYLAKHFLSEPAFLVAFVIVLGLLLQKKPIDQVMAGTVKGVIGFLLIMAGAQSLGQTLLPLQPMLQHLFGMKVSIPSFQEAQGAGLAAFGAQATLIFAFGFLVNVFLARFTPFKYIHLSAHVSFFYAGLIAALLTVGTHLPTIHIVWIGSLLLGLYMTLTPAMVAPLMKHIPGGEGFTLGHSSSIACVLSGYLGKIVGNRKKNLEDLKLPGQLDFLREVTISVTVIMMLFVLVLSLLSGKFFVEQHVSGHKDWLAFALLLGLKFGVGITMIVTGVRMMLGEIISAFHGISDRLVPQSTPGLDVPLLFPNHPNSVIIGFLCSLTTGLIGMVILGWLQYPIVVFPALIPTFFTGAAAAIFGNATGGRRGAIIGASLNGLLLIFGQAFLLPYVGSYEPVMRVLSETDYTFYGPIIGWLLSCF